MKNIIKDKTSIILPENIGTLDQSSRVVILEQGQVLNDGKFDGYYENSNENIDLDSVVSSMSYARSVQNCWNLIVLDRINYTLLHISFFSILPLLH